MMPLDFVPLWTLILGFGVFMYVLMDGFDLGVGILFRRAPSDASRDIMMNSVAPIWDGNETWLVLGGVALLAAFPLAFAIILPALYFPILIMLMALIFRGIAFELRFKASPQSQASLGCGVPLWLPGRHAGTGFRARRVRAGVPRRWPLLRRRFVRLVDTVLGPHGDQSGARLCAARGDLADHEDGRRPCRIGRARKPDG